MDALDRLADAKVRLNMKKDLLFYTCVMAQLDILIGKTRFGTADTDGINITFEDNFVGTLNDDELQGIILHEVRHITDMHVMRKGDRDHDTFNQACDHVINLELIASGYVLPDWVLKDTRFRNMSVEEVYDILITETDKKPNPMPDLIEPGEGEDSGDSTQTPKQLMEAVEADVKDILIQAVQATEKALGKGAGNIPQSTLLAVDAWLNPVVPWNILLQRYLTSKVNEDTSWRRPKRRGIPHGLYLPITQTDQVGDINLYMDLSCSVSDDMVNMQVSQFRYIHQVLKPKSLRIVTFNTRIISDRSYGPNSKLDLNFTGQGGTHIAEVVKHMQDNPADLHLMFTDGYFQQYPLDKISGEIIMCIYDNPDYVYEGATKIIEIPE